MILYRGHDVDGGFKPIGFDRTGRERNRCQPHSNNSEKGQKIYFIDQKTYNFFGQNRS